MFFDHPQSTTITATTTSVDCTLSIGTPSTRLSNNISHHKQQPSTFTHFYYSPYKPTSTRTAASNASSSESLLARRCANCDNASTPLWRNGPRGPKFLCNACGIRFKKEERRAMAAATAHPTIHPTY